MLGKIWAWLFHRCPECHQPMEKVIDADPGALGFHVYGEDYGWRFERVCTEVDCSRRVCVVTNCYGRR